MSLPDGLSVQPIIVEQTYDLRNALLITDAHGDDPVPEDAWPDTFHRGVVDANGTVLSTVTMCPADRDGQHSDTTIRLRAMATASEWQGRGLGAELVKSVVTELQDSSFESIWSNTRDVAQGFYERLGFVVEGEGFMHAEIPHHVAVLKLSTG